MPRIRSKLFVFLSDATPRYSLVEKNLYNFCVIIFEEKFQTPHEIPFSADNLFIPQLALPFAATLRRSLIDSARPSSTSTVDSQLMQASVMLTPFLSPDGPSGGTF